MTTQSIWQYKAQTECKSILFDVFRSSSCPCCKTPSKLYESDRKDESDGRRHSEYQKAMCCQSCGWWFYSRDVWDSSCGSRPDSALRTLSATGAALKEFSTSVKPETILNLKAEIEQHIHRKGKSKDWAALEDTTSAILKEFGYTPRTTARSKDGGVDVIFEDTANNEVFAQIKHSKNSIGVSVLRELIGTLVLNEGRKGLIVTSSEYTSGLRDERQKAETRGFTIELVKGEEFLDALNLTHRLSPPTLKEITNIASRTVNLIYEEVDF